MKTFLCCLWLGWVAWGVSAGLHPPPGQAPAGSLAGRVVARENNQPLAGAKITLTRSVTKDAYTAETNAKGEFRLDGLPPGNYVVEADAEGRTGVRLNVLQTVEAGKTLTLKTPLKLEVERTYSVIRGAVFNERGLTMPGVTVVAERLSSSDPGLKPGKVGATVTNGAGEFAFRFPGADAVYRLTAQARGYQPQTKELDVQKREARNMAFQLEPEPPRRERVNE